MSANMMPTIDQDPNATDPVPESHLGTHPGTGEVFDERFRRSRMRADIFGGEASELRLGRYRIEERLGAGAMGSVYLAVDEGLERNVAVKVLRRQDAVDRARIQAEAKALAKLSHPNVVTVHEVGEHEGEAFVAMEYVAGQTLTQWLQTKRTLPEILWMFDQAATGLHAAHEAGIVHRDFKPDNVLVGADGRVRVVDFGMARTLAAPLTREVDEPASPAALAAPTLTRTGVLAGTPAYMSPEQFLGANVDARADQFAFCVALYEAIWGVRPYRGETLEELAKSVTAGPPALSAGRHNLESQEAERVRGVIRRGLSVQPNHRFASMAALFDELRPRVRSAGRGSAVGRAILLLAAVMLFIMFAGGVAAYMVLARRGSDTPDAAAACGPGTVADGNGCTELPWDPALVQCEADGSCRLPRWVLRRAIDSPEFRDEVGRYGPSVANGVTVGFALDKAGPSTLSARLGLVDGDVVRSVDGVDVASNLEAIIERISTGDGVESFEIALQRDGVAMTRTVTLTADD